MASITHAFVSTKTDVSDSSKVGSAKWNAAHTLTGVIAAANGGTGVSNTGTLSIVGVNTIFRLDSESNTYIINFDGSVTYSFAPSTTIVFSSNVRVIEEAGYEELQLLPLAGGYASILKMQNSGGGELTYTLTGGGTLALGGFTLTAPATGTIALRTSATGTFTTVDGKTVTVANGVITSIV